MELEGVSSSIAKCIVQFFLHLLLCCNVEAQ